MRLRDLFWRLAQFLRIPSANVPSSNPTSPPSEVVLYDGLSGALVTYDCLFENDYPYAIDIYWSCGDERFNNALRLHTFKRHSYEHRKIFADQLLQYFNKRLWFKEYNPPRCIAVDEESGRLTLRTAPQECNEFQFLLDGDDLDGSTPTPSAYIQEVSTEQCLTLGTGVTCNDDRSTGGSECGGVDHRFLPLVV